MRDYIRDADEALRGTYEEPMSLAEYVESAFESPSIASHASKYLLEAIESMGTRQVVEQGEEKERYRFFDDPANDGEHAILGNTDVLNAFVDDLRTIAADRGKAEKIVWFDGPTATGKSELKRCLINGLREYSKTDAGRRYTVEWNVANAEDTRGLSYGGEVDADDEDWYESPVQSHPLSVFPSNVRRQLLRDLNRANGDHIPISVNQDLDPFCLEAYNYLEEEFRRAGKNELFSTVTDPKHLRVKNYVVDVGRGIGVLHSEDDGTPKERLVGSWMPSMLRELNSRGRKNPQAFSFDGVLSQGNGLLTIVEDAAQHADLLQKLLNVPDEGHVKLDKGIGMDIDTQLVIISNPDLDAELDKFADRNGRDPLKALKRRLNKHEFRYLTNLSLEAELIRRELTNETSVWTDDPEAMAERVAEAVTLDVRKGPGKVQARELAPHTIEAAALYSVVTRLDPDDIPRDPELEFDLVDKALLFDRGYLQVGDQRREVSAFEFIGDSEGTHGIPVTFTRDVIADLLHDRIDRRHPDLDVSSVVMPGDVLDEMVGELPDAPVFSRAEASEYEGRIDMVEDHIFEQQEADVLDALLAEKGVERETVEEYVEHVYAWASDGQLETEHGLVDPDPLLMKLFETEHLGRFAPADYEGNDPSEEVETFRHEKVITALNRYAWENRDEGFTVSDVDLTEIPVIRTVLETHDWEDVRRLFPDLEPRQWDDPPANTETARVKDRTIDEMVKRGYTTASAELTSRAVMKRVSQTWD
ncbi:kinase anchor protein [Haloferax mediterranei ATCC 33500]|nr:serine protein kinase [Haloferax mediterranei]AFK20508.1 serine protein kinase [Haloferax mediterranei ATCC 33500]ELZ98291.1 serine protein kinase [Haloferax mediterranei ATCC 33500]MDX5986736.1 kinase anchor protein [Haloferax mediterranei ATCC 33500]QCQ76060.1 kinase anchor protein [Haloferax mediterranei ATCC 33500]